MISSELFSNALITEDTDLAYKNICSGKRQRHIEIREYCEKLWFKYQSYADSNFLSEIRKHFHQRFWEMYLTVSLMEMGFEVKCPKPGPDLGIEVDGKTIWFEATCPTRGEEGSPNQVPAVKDGTAQDIPNSSMILRYLNIIDIKFNVQYQTWLEQNIVSSDDVFIIAINVRMLDFDYADTVPPRILQTAFPLGDPYIEFDQLTSEVNHTGYEYRNLITKVNGSEVGTGIFLDENYKQLSGLLCSRIDAANLTDFSGQDFQLVPNPNACNPIPLNFNLRGTFFSIEVGSDAYRIIPKKYTTSSNED